MKETRVVASHDRFRAGKRLWSEADDRLVRDRYPHTPTSALATRLRRSLSSVYERAQHLGVCKSAAYLASAECGRLRGDNPRSVAHRFQKGQTAFNKGLKRGKGWAPGRMKDGQFKPGERRGVAVTLYKPVGTERVSKDGYLERKVNDNLPLQARWRAVHRILWEQAHGPLPTGHAIVFRNGDKTDRRLDNLECITRRALMARNTVHNLPKPLAQVVQLLGALHRQIRRRTPRAEQDGRPQEPSL